MWATPAEPHTIIENTIYDNCDQAKSAYLTLLGAHIEDRGV